MLKNPKLEERRKNMPLEVKILMDKTFAIVEQLDIVLKSQNKTQKDLADLLSKRESEISKWMRGTHNFTQKTIAKIEAVLGETITMCPKDVKLPVYNIFVLNAEQNALSKNNLPRSGNTAVKDNRYFTASVKAGDQVVCEDLCAQLN